MNTLIAIAVSAAAAGTLDLFSAIFLAHKRGMSPTAVLQFVASGALGESALKGGPGAATAGLFFHYLIALFWAAACSMLAGERPELLAHPFASGILYGVVIHLIMSLIVLPLSRTPKRPFAWAAWIIQLAIHAAFVGLPIVLIQSWWIRR
jgi:hypothetical protein